MQAIDKQQIRERLFEGTIGEEDKAFALHNALVVAKVVRIDYPDDWRDALPSVIDLLRAHKNGNQLFLGGALIILLRVVKELGTARLRKSQTALQSVTPEMVYLLGEIYTERTTMWVNWLTTGQGDEDDADIAMQNSLFCLKTLRLLLIVGYENPSQDKVVLEFWSVTQSHFGQFLGYVSHDSAVPAPYQDVVGKHLLQFTKLHLEMSVTHPASFPLLPNSIPLVQAYWDLVAKFAEVFDKSGGLRQTTAGGLDSAKSKVEGPLLEKLALKGLLLIKNCNAIVWRPIQTFKYKTSEVKLQQSEAISTINTQLMTDEFVLQIVNVIVTKLLIFRQADLDAWDLDPEEFESTEKHLGDAWAWEVRPCAERVFLDLLVHYKALVSPPLLSYFHSAAKSDSDVITKEAIYTAMGGAAPNLFEVFDFDTFLSTTIVQDAQYTGPLAKVLRRRIAILLSLWVPVKIDDANRPLVFDIYRHLLNKKDAINDEVVRITAARQLKWIADDFNFPGEVCVPYAPEIFTQLLNLLGDVAIDDTKQALFETLRLFIQRMEAHISPFGDQIMSAIPGLWDAAGEDFMSKQSILSVLSGLVSSLGSESQRYQRFMLPIIAHAMDANSQIHIFLLDDTVDLWKTVMSQSSPPLAPELIRLEPTILPLTSHQEMHISQDSLEIVKSYIVLAPEAMLSDATRQATLEALCGAMSSRDRSEVCIAAKSIDYILRAAEEFGGSDGVSVIVQDMLEIGFLRQVLSGIHGAWESHQTTGPNRKSNPLETVLETDYFAILGRIAVADSAVFIGLLERFGGLNQVWSWLSAEWFSAFDSMADGERQKLSCLALTRLCELPQPIQDLVLGKLQDYFCMWTSVVLEVHEGDANGPDCLVWSAAPQTEYDTPQDRRESAIALKDPVHSVHTFNFIRERLQDLVQRTGGEEQFQANWTVNVDRDVLAGFQDLSNPRPNDE